MAVTTTMIVVMAIAAASAAAAAANARAQGKMAQAAAVARNKGLEHQATQARQVAGQVRASSQRGAAEQRRLARFAESTALARAAASGAGAADPTVENILGDIGAEGEFRALSELFMGEERARGLETAADLKIFEGAQELIAGDFAEKMGRRIATQKLLAGAANVASAGTTGGAGSGLARFG